MSLRMSAEKLSDSGIFDLEALPNLSGGTFTTFPVVPMSLGLISMVEDYVPMHLLVAIVSLLTVRAFGWLGKELLSKATSWLQAAPAAGYYYPELISHPVSVTNFREIYNDHIGVHILAFVLAFARGLHVFIPQQLRREWKKSPRETGDVVHLPEATALVVGVGGIGAEAARLLAAFGVTVLAQAWWSSQKRLSPTARPIHLPVGLNRESPGAR